MKNLSKVKVYSEENISLGGEVEVFVSEDSLISYLEYDGKEYDDFDGYFGTCSIGTVEDMIKEEWKVEWLSTNILQKIAIVSIYSILN